VEERRTAAAVALGDFDAHDPQLEELVDEGARDLGLLVHLPHERPDLAIRELVDAGLEQPFVFGQCGQRARDELGVLDRHDENLITRDGRTTAYRRLESV
jgi:hypothetical protein